MHWKDQLGRHISLKGVPQRVLSLVPSQTELIADLGAIEKLVGRTKFCIHPEEVKQIPVIGGTKNIHLDRVDRLQPDLIIANKEENDQAQVEALAARYPVWVSDVKDITTACDMILAVGQLLDKVSNAREMTEIIKKGFSNSDRPAQSAVYLIWRDPWMSAGNDTFISSMLSHAGLRNLISEPRYPVLEMDQLQRMDPEVILLSSEPYPFQEKHLDEISKLLPNAKLKLVDGEMFSWYGSRLIKAIPYITKFQI